MTGGEHFFPDADDADESWYIDDDAETRENRVRAANLCDEHPERFVSACKIWTPKRNTIETVASHDRLVGELLAVLVSMTEPRTDEQRAAMQRLRDVFYGDLGTPEPDPEDGKDVE
jgi:hypothetical protein